MAGIPFLKKFSLPRFSAALFRSRPDRAVGIDIGFSSTKVVELRYEDQRAILQTYGELKNQGYMHAADALSGGFLKYRDADLVSLVGDALRESRVGTKDALFSVPAHASFVVPISLPGLDRKEAENAISFEARKYVPIPLSEVALDWEILEINPERSILEVLLVAVPREVVEKIKRVAEGARLSLRAIEVESFSAVRSLVGRDLTPCAIINIGFQNTIMSITDQARLRMSRSISQGSHAWTIALERASNLSPDRAEALKRDVGLSERLEEREITSVLLPLVDGLLNEAERTIRQYNRSSSRTIQRVILTGGGSGLKGLIEAAATRLGVEVVRGNPFGRVVTPALIEPMLRDIGPSFAVAVGLALNPFSTR